MQKFSLRGYTGKELVAEVRGGDYSHPGEEQAIIEVMQHLPKNSNQLILDAGCGRGGTANFIQQHGWGKVCGIDIDAKAIAYAQKKHKANEFYAGDIVDTAKILAPKKFAAICMFNAFFAFPDQLKALTALRQVAADNATLAIFDYLDLSHGKSYLLKAGNIIPLSEDTIYDLLNQSGWDSSQLTFQDITPKYDLWYREMLQRLADKKELLIAKYGEDPYQYTCNRFSEFVAGFKDKTWGGAIIYAKVAPESRGHL